jgi:hypothetical protein
MWRAVCAKPIYYSPQHSDLRSVAFSSSSCLRISLIYFSTHRFRILPFTALSSGCPFGFPCGWPSRTECLTAYNLVLFLRSVLQLYGTLPAFQLSCSTEYCSELASRFSPVPLTQPSNERLAFFGLTERSDHSFRSTSDSSVVQTREPEWSGSLLS